MKWFEKLSGQYGEFANSTDATMALIRMKQNKPRLWVKKKKKKKATVRKQE